MTETTTPEFTISRMKVIDAPTNKAGNRLLAVFDVLIAGIKVNGCVLIEKDNGEVKASGPRGQTHRGENISVSIQDGRLEGMILVRASTLYEGFTGRSPAA